MKKNLTILALLRLLITTGVVSTNLYAQTAIGGGTPDPSAMLDVQSTSKGLLIPRMTTAERNAIASPATGLMIFNSETTCWQINLGTSGSPAWQDVICNGAISTLDCAGATLTGSLLPNTAASGVSISVPYTGGNGGVYPGETVTSSSVTGLTATLSSGNFASGGGSLTYTISGTPSASGAANFALNVGGQACSLSVQVQATCGAFMAAGMTDWRVFSCYNLGAANTNADPFTPSWEINGGYYQWGIKTEAAAGPTGPDTGQANDAAIAGWNQTRAAAGSWADPKNTTNDPCPDGFRVPTNTEWQAVIDFNTPTLVGPWTGAGITEYRNGIKFGNSLMLPTAGDRKGSDGELERRGSRGYYWASPEMFTTMASNLVFSILSGNLNPVVNENDKLFGFSVRCIED